MGLASPYNHHLAVQTVAWMFSLGCIIHSVIIGISLGVIDADHGRARNIYIALCFHELLEGVGLGTFIAMANYPLWKGECGCLQATCPKKVQHPLFKHAVCTLCGPNVRNHNALFAGECQMM